MVCRWLIQDTLKVLTYWVLFKFDIFRIKSGSYGGKDGRRPGEEQLLGIQVSHKVMLLSMGGSAEQS